MKATTIKQIKFNRGQVSDLLSERMDMGLQNACGTVYDNIYINRYGQIQNAPNCLFCDNGFLLRPDENSGVSFQCKVLGIFDTGEDVVLAVCYDQANNHVCIFGPYPKTNPYIRVSSFRTSAELDLGTIFPERIKFLQFGYNVLLYGQECKPKLLNITPNTADPAVGWANPILTVKENYFDGAFDNIYVRGLNTEIPSDFTVPTSGAYIIEGKQITTKLIAKVKRNGAGGAFTQSLVGQVINSPANGGVLQVRSVEDADTLYAYIMSPFVALSSTATDIRIPWNSTLTRLPSINYNYDSAKWVFGYEKAYGDTQAPYSQPSYPDSAIYVNQRLIFGGNDYHGNLVSASRIGVINDFDPESGTESDAFTVGISSKDFCRVVNFVVSNNELRVACTNGEYAMSLANLTPSGSLNGFDLRSEVGIAKDTAICDCGGLTAYVSSDKTAIYGTQFSLLRDRYQPISLSSQTENIINNCLRLQYLTNRPNSESNCLVGLNEDSSLVVGAIDLNAGLVSMTKFLKREYTYAPQGGISTQFKLVRIFAVGNCLWGVLSSPGWISSQMLVRFYMGEMFDLPCWVRKPTDTHPDTLTVSTTQAGFYDIDKIRALYKDPETQEYKIIQATGKVDNNDGTTTITFADDIVLTNIVVAGHPRQSDWRSVEIGMGMATRELNKNIIKIEGVIEPTQVTGAGRFAGLVLTPEESKNFITLTRSKDVEPMDVDNLGNTSYTESQDLVWRRAFDNPDRELHYGVSMIAPFLVKSITATVQYDEVS